MDNASVPNPSALAPRPRFDDLLPRLMEESESHERRKLLREARAGSAGALCLLWEMYHLRLPLVEQRVAFTFPWMRASPGNPRRRRRRRAAGAGGARRGSNPLDSASSAPPFFPEDGGHTKEGPDRGNTLVSMLPGGLRPPRNGGRSGRQGVGCGRGDAA